MNSRTWRAGALGVSIAVILLLATQPAAGEPKDALSPSPSIRQTIMGANNTLPGFAIPESGSLLLLGSAFVVVAHQLRRFI